ncbi:hypothetical protein BB559_006765 [Furculomyces boomerangus]|uniref:Ysc84 actin-binding domain-containing protein n=2 Tax=Harpellales TaxID=61421 RepID=A0A2T9Y0P0_9FUNG|nr:hypothetical protein BB559_006765 [Furculomyces boomerangus]PWA00410.1 hypothetical protein BB558_003539 [Smittium angustum]
MNFLHNPIPTTLNKDIENAISIISSFIEPQEVQATESIIPRDVLDTCSGIAVLTVVKGGIVWSARAGSGLVIAKLPDGKWSAPSAIGTAGFGFGGQIGAEITDFVMLLRTPEAVKAFSRGGNVTLGTNIAIAAGPVGRNAEVSGSVLNTAPIYSYSKSKGLFVGISLEGSAIIERKDANSDFYGRKVSATDILSGAVPQPSQAAALYSAIEKRSTNAKSATSDSHPPTQNTSSNTQL